ncbi:hypothetical protein VPNG_06631 [Cytospora leucostoma]|uniref:RNA polymerase II degradation factor 1 n=1 Tax=Cytospora leucostoma TaxID=1230097 RepID=A0A423WU78_9PEZI|nr:hypothetical protein VPNG_06631 [Cytospora leucostoma]
MSDVQTRPTASRGRGAPRGGRGGFSSRGGRNASRSAAATNGDAKHDSESNALPSLEDQGEIGDLNKQYGTKVSLIKEMFPDWTEVDILYALKETDGDETTTIERMAEGTISQWGEVSKQKKDKSKSKSKDTFTTTTGADAPATNARSATRGGRPEGGRGRGRATERGGRGAARARPSQATTNGPAKETQPLSVPTEESSAWDTTKTADDGGWSAAAANATPWDANATATDAPSAAPSSAPAKSAAPEPAKSAVIPQGTAKTWASMLRQSTVPKPAPQPPKETPAHKPEPAVEPLPAPAEQIVPEPEPEPEPVAAETPAESQQEQTPAENPPTVVLPEVALPPSKDQLTETNLEQVVDESHPPVTETAASEAADSWDPRAAQASATATPISASQAQHQAPKASSNSGFAATANRATDRTPVPRAPSHTQRRFLNQEEAVRMPQAASQQLERTTLQFGAFNLNESEDDIDGDREEPETRAQPPADSPVTQPRASLPPAPAAAAPEAFPAQKPQVALPPTTGPSGTAFPTSQEAARAAFGDFQSYDTNANPAAPAPPTAPAAQQQPTPQGTLPDPVSLDPSIQQIGRSTLTSPPQPAPAAQPQAQPAAQQFSRFGQQTAQEQTAFPPKPFDSYNQGTPTAPQSQFEGFPSQQQSQPQSQQPGGAYSSAADQYSSFYTADQQNRPPYNYYAQNYGQQQQQTSQAQPDSGLAARAGFAGYGASQADLASQYPQSANQTRFGTAVAQDPSSGNTTPNPTAQGQPQPGQAHPQAHAGQQQQQQQQQHGSHFYNQPYGGYGQYYSNYMNQYGGYGQGGFGPYGKGAGLYGQPHHYGISQQTPFDHTSSPAAGYPQASLHRADSGVGSGLGDYGRAGSAQSGAQPALGSAGFGGIDSFGRATSYGQAGQSFNAPSTQPGGAASSSEDLKPFGDAKAASGPSPSLVGARPGSATNTGPSQAGLPPPQSAQQGIGYGGYPSHLQGAHGLHGAQTGATGYGIGAGSAQAHQNSPYSGYGGFGAGNSYYGSAPRHGGWGANYGGGSNF